LAFTSKLMPAPAMAEFWRDIPAPLVLIENALRVLVFALPFVMPLQITTKRDRRADADPVLRGRSFRHRRDSAASGRTHPECRDHHLSDWGHIWLGHDDDDVAERIASLIRNPAPEGAP